MIDATTNISTLATAQGLDRASIQKEIDKRAKAIKKVVQRIESHRQNAEAASDAVQRKRYNDAVKSDEANLKHLQKQDEVAMRRLGGEEPEEDVMTPLSAAEQLRRKEYHPRRKVTKALRNAREKALGGGGAVAEEVPKEQAEEQEKQDIAGPSSYVLPERHAE
jgi:hypothetical protein